MSETLSFGRHKVIFATEADHATESKIELPPPEPSTGLITSSGEINWNCPCLGGMATGPCGVDFREAFSCFHYSTAEPKGSDCYEQFKTMQDCFSEYPAVYNKNDGDDDDDGMPDLSSLDDQSEKEPSKDEVEAKK